MSPRAPTSDSAAEIPKRSPSSVRAKSCSIRQRSRIRLFLGRQTRGKSGRVIGVDMTPDMVVKARDNARQVHADNVEFRLGEVETLPVGDSSVDAILSNCVINLSPDKSAVFREAFRVLKPGGHSLSRTWSPRRRCRPSLCRTSRRSPDASPAPPASSRSARRFEQRLRRSARRTESRQRSAPRSVHAGGRRLRRIGGDSGRKAGQNGLLRPYVLRSQGVGVSDSRRRRAALSVSSKHDFGLTSRAVSLRCGHGRRNPGNFRTLASRHRRARRLRTLWPVGVSHRRARCRRSLSSSAPLPIHGSRGLENGACGEHRTGRRSPPRRARRVRRAVRLEASHSLPRGGDAHGARGHDAKRRCRDAGRVRFRHEITGAARTRSHSGHVRIVLRGHRRLSRSRHELRGALAGRGTRRLPVRRHFLG